MSRERPEATSGADQSVWPTVGVVQLVSNVAATVGRAVLIDCTSAGNITLQFDNGSQITINLQANQLYEFNWAITKFIAGSATANVWLEL